MGSHGDPWSPHSRGTGKSPRRCVKNLGTVRHRFDAGLVLTETVGQRAAKCLVEGKSCKFIFAAVVLPRPVELSVRWLFSLVFS